MKYLFAFLTFTLLSNCSGNDSLPDGFVYLDEEIHDINVSLRYHSTNNFMGSFIDGYEGDRCILSAKASKALSRVQSELRDQEMSLKVFDAYRPQTAVNHFIRWAEDLEDTLNKQAYYPHVPKEILFEEGYIASRSGHTRGSTLDLTIVDVDGNELDMGSPWDFFGPESWPFHEDLTEKQKSNRMLLRNLMIKHGFQPYDKEWWHFTLKDEPFPDQYFDFPVK